MTDAGAARVSAVTSAVARQVRELRAARGWSFEELAGRSGVSKGMLVQIEGARTNPSIGTLCRVADAFGVNIARLLEPAEETHRAAHRGRRGAGALAGRAGRKRPTAQRPRRAGPGGTLGLAAGTRARRTTPPITPAAPERCCTFSAGRRSSWSTATTHEVRAGETIEFHADREHGYRNAGDEPARLVMVVVTPSGEWDRRTRSRRPRPE